MNKAEWQDKIKESCEAAGTYQPFFDSVIDSLAGIMEMRDNAQKSSKHPGAIPSSSTPTRAGRQI